MKCSPYVCGMKTKQENKTMITFKIEKNDWGFYTTTLYEDGKLVGFVESSTKTQARKTTSSQKKLREHIAICKIFS